VVAAFSISSRNQMGRLSKKFVESLRTAESPFFAWDDQLAGFGIKVLPTGRRKYVCKYRLGGGRAGRDRWYLIGTHGQITCEEARGIAVQILAAVARGEDPQSERLQARSAPTVFDLWQRYETEHLPRKKIRSGIDDRQKARDHILPIIGHLRVADLSRSDVSALHRRLASRPYQANRVLALLSKMLSLSEAWGYRPDATNPCRHVEKFTERPRQRYLSNEELGRLGCALSDLRAKQRLGAPAVSAIKLLLLTGARVSEILKAEWKWVDLERSCIWLPDSKTGPKTIFLSEASLAVLRELQIGSQPFESVFVIEGRSKDKRLSSLAKPWRIICQAARLHDVRLHDLRHTAASVGVGQGISLEIVGRLLGHTQAQTTQRYAHVDRSPALKAINSIGEAIGLALETGAAAAAAR
jgi:integrase